MIKLYNTLERKKVEFKPVQKGVMKIYSCGPTVYSRQHIGNMRAALCWDFLKRAFRYFDYKVEDVMNITDVGHLVSDESDGEDKMLKASKKENLNPFDIARKYEEIFVEDMKKIHVLMPKYMPRATEHIKEQLDVIAALDKKGYVYKIEDGLYFDVMKFKKYGQLSKQNLADKRGGARVDVKGGKKSPFDFALWKFLTGENENHIMKWDSKWGVGFPGWHIECSAMSHKYLGDKFDIHTGGIEHISVHHENEIAQNTCSGCVKKVGVWMHNEHLLVNSEKMAKSLGNVYNVDEIIKKGYNPLAFREMCLRAHYRKQMNFTFDSLEAGQAGVKKINEFVNRLKSMAGVSGGLNIQEIYEKRINDFKIALEDDMNTSVALAAVYEFMNDVNKSDLLTVEDVKRALEFMAETDVVLGLIEVSDDVPKEIFALAMQRKQARENKDWGKSDELREEIGDKGWEIKDDKSAKDGFILKKG